MGEVVERVGEIRVVVRVMGGEEGDRDVGKGESGGVGEGVLWRVAGMVSGGRGAFVERCGACWSGMSPC